MFKEVAIIVDGNLELKFWLHDYFITTHRNRPIMSTLVFADCVEQEVLNHPVAMGLSLEQKKEMQYNVELMRLTYSRVKWKYISQ